MLELCFVTITLCKMSGGPPQAATGRKGFGISMARFHFSRFAQKFTLHAHRIKTEMAIYVLQHFAGFCQFFAVGVVGLHTQVTEFMRHRWDYKNL